MCSSFNVTIKSSVDRAVSLEFMFNFILKPCVSLVCFYFFKIVICGAFYPFYFVSGDIDDVECMKQLSGHDPFSTVMVFLIFLFIHLLTFSFIFIHFFTDTALLLLWFKFVSLNGFMWFILMAIILFLFLSGQQCPITWNFVQGCNCFSFQKMWQREIFAFWEFKVNLYPKSFNEFNFFLFFFI